MSAIPREVAAADDLDAVMDGLRVALARPGDEIEIPRRTLERWSRHTGRALLFVLDES